ncbi:MAG TPA: hypothetical protein PLY45_00185 [bacterium]|nr:hypothetical protein [bacterium]
MILKETALGSGGKYQTTLNQILRQALLGDGVSILDRLDKLEKAVFKKTKAA